MKNFVKGLEFFQLVAAIAEEEGLLSFALFYIFTSLAHYRPHQVDVLLTIIYWVCQYLQFFAVILTVCVPNWIPHNRQHSYPALSKPRNSPNLLCHQRMTPWFQNIYFPSYPWCHINYVCSNFGTYVLHLVSYMLQSYLPWWEILLYICRGKYSWNWSWNFVIHPESSKLGTLFFVSITFSATYV